MEEKWIKKWILERKPLGMSLSTNDFALLFLLLGFTFMHLCFVFRSWTRKDMDQSPRRSLRDSSSTMLRTTISSTWRRCPKGTVALKAPGFLVPLEAARMSCKGRVVTNACILKKTLSIQNVKLLFQIGKKQWIKAKRLKKFS